MLERLNKADEAVQVTDEVVPVQAEILEEESLKKGKDTELTPEIVNLIRKYHNSIAGHVGENCHWM